MMGVLHDELVKLKEGVARATAVLSDRDHAFNQEFQRVMSAFADRIHAIEEWLHRATNHDSADGDPHGPFMTPEYAAIRKVLEKVEVVPAAMTPGHAGAPIAEPTALELAAAARAMGEEPLVNTRKAPTEG